MTESRLTREKQARAGYSGLTPVVTREFLEYLASRDCRINVIRVLPYAYEKQGLKPLNLQQIKRLAKALEKNTSVQTLDLGNVLDTKEFNDDVKKTKAFKAIANLLKKNTHIETLFLNGNPISSIASHLLAEAFTHSTIQHLSMISCQFETLSGITQILESLQNSSELQFVALNGSIPQKELIKTPFQLLSLYEKMAKKVHFETAIKTFFEQLIEERELLSARIRKTDSTVVFPAIQNITPPAKRVKVTGSKSMDPLPEIKSAQLQPVSPLFFSQSRRNRYAINALVSPKVEVKQEIQNRKKF